MNTPLTPDLSHRRRAALSFATLAFLLSGCGGGGDASTSTDVSASSTDAAAPLPEAQSVNDTDVQALRRVHPTPAPAPAPTPAPAPPAAGATCGIADFQATVLARINQWRAAGADCRSAGKFAATTALVWNAKLTLAAAGHSQDMATRNYFSHTSADGRTFVDRINATGYAWSSLGENIAAGYPTVNAVVDGWIASDGHCANIMNPNFRDVGLACVAGTSTSAYRTYWTMDVGKPR